MEKRKMSRLRGGADIEAVALGAQSFHALARRIHVLKHTICALEYETKGSRHHSNIRGLG
jgi:hypothetical protein